jgi:hypothetical protein
VADAKAAGFVHYLNVLAKGNGTAAAQYDLTGGNGSMTTLVQPDVPRNIKITITDADVGIDAFTVTVTGTAPDGSAAVEVFNEGGGLVQVGSVIFATVTSIVLTDLNGAGVGDTLDAGYQDKIGAIVPANTTDLVINALKVGGTLESAAAVDQAKNSFTPTTVPDGANDYEVWYSYSNATLNALLAQLRSNTPSPILPT